MASVRRALVTFHKSHHDDVIKWKYFPRYWPFVRGIHRSPANSPHMTRGFDVSFDMRLEKQFSKQSWRQNQCTKIITIKPISWVIALKWNLQTFLTHRGLHIIVNTLHDYIFRYILLNHFFLHYDLNGRNFSWLCNQIHLYQIFLFHDLNVIE